jgi:hypothetical protein
MSTEAYDNQSFESPTEPSVAKRIHHNQTDNLDTNVY